MELKSHFYTRDTNSNVGHLHSWETMRQRREREKGGRGEKIKNKKKGGDERMEAKREEGKEEMKAAGTAASLK